MTTGCAQWEGDLRDTVVNGEGGEEHKEPSQAPLLQPLCGFPVVPSQDGDAGLPSMHHLNTLGQWLSTSREYQSHLEGYNLNTGGWGDLHSVGWGQLGT